MKNIPVAGLRAFEAAARLCNFRQAGLELGMTSTAVSQHVRALEAWLGVPLFLRGPRGVTLTEAGEEFGRAVCSGLGVIGDTALRLKAKQEGQTVRLACLPSIVAHWLSPRLDRFRAAHPHISVAISYAGQARSPQDAKADLLIQHGEWPRDGATRILDASTRPTCSPDYLARHGSIACEDDLRSATLLHDETPLAWRRWFSEGELAPPQEAGPLFADFNMLLGSLIAGSGVALCPTNLISRELADGRLVILFDRAIDQDRAYSLLRCDAPNPAVATMHDWLVGESQA